MIPSGQNESGTGRGKPPLSLRLSLLARSVHSWAWVVFALLGVLPILAILRLIVLVWLRPGAVGPALFEFAGLSLFIMISLLSGLYLLRYLVRNIEQTWEETTELDMDAVRPPASEAWAEETTAGWEHRGTGSADGGRASAISDFEWQSQNELEGVTITMRRLREALQTNIQAIHRQEIRLQTLEYAINNVNEAVLILNESNVVTFANLAARTILGVAEGSNIQRALAESSLPEEAWTVLSDWFTRWEERREEFAFMDTASGPRTFRIHIQPLAVEEEQNSGLMKLVIVRDESDRRRMERQLLRSERLAALGQLISGIAHELNNPLAAILGFSELCRDPRTSPEDVKRHLQVIEREARRTHHIVRDLLNFSRQRKPQRSPTDVRELLDRCLTLLSYQFRVLNIDVERQYPESVPTVHVDEFQLQQVFVNIMINASQAMAEAEIPDRRILIRVRLTEDQKEVAVDIRDSGPGIPPEALDRVFEPFFTTKPEGVGTGLGLSVSQAIVKKHGGTISVQSEPGNGATFTVTLPVATARTLQLKMPDRSKKAGVKVLRPAGSTAPSSVGEPAGPSERMHGRILLVDDEIAVCTLARHVLERLGFEVETAHCLQEARERLEAGRYDALLCDIRLPDGDVADLWQQIKATCPGLLAATAFMTGDPRAGNQLQERVGAPLRVIHKPFHLEELTNTVKELIGGGRQVRSS